MNRYEYITHTYIKIVRIYFGLIAILVSVLFLSSDSYLVKQDFLCVTDFLYVKINYSLLCWMDNNI